MVGKTCLLLRMADNPINELKISTIGFSFESVQFTNDEGDTSSVFLWDTAGQEKFASISKSLLRKAHGALLVYSVESRDSFNRLEKWINDLNDSNTDKIPCVIIGNKIDVEYRTIDENEARVFANEMEYPYFECSALNNTSTIKDAFRQLSKLAIESRMRSPQTDLIPAKKKKCTFLSFFSTLFD